MRECAKCKEIKPLREAFYPNKRSREGYLTICKLCVQARQKAYVAKNRDEIAVRMKQYHTDNREKLLEQQRRYKAVHAQRLRDLKREKETGFSPELFANTLIAQEGRCALCECILADLPRHQVHADHCHDTLTPRGVLCGGCNTSLGKLGDSLARLRRVVAYLENPPALSIQQLL